MYYICVAVNEKMPSLSKNIVYSVDRIKCNGEDIRDSEISYEACFQYSDPSPCVADDFHCKQGS